MNATLIAIGTAIANLLTARLGDKSLKVGGGLNLGSAAVSVGFLGYAIANPDTKVLILLHIAEKGSQAVLEFNLVIPAVLMVLGTIYAEFLRRAGTQTTT